MDDQKNLARGSLLDVMNSTKTWEWFLELSSVWMRE